MIDQLDDDTVLRLPAYGHTDQYVYQFPSGIMTVVWGDRSSVTGKIGLMDKDHVRKVVREKYSEENMELVPFEESPYSDEWEGEE